MTSSENTSTTKISSSSGDQRTFIPVHDLEDPKKLTVGELVKNATAQISTLVRAEIELAKSELTAEIKRALQGGVFFVLALVVLLFSSFFFFFFFAELLDVWVPRWAAFLIVFAVMLLATALFAFIGYLRVRKIRAPEKTIESLKSINQVVPNLGVKDKDATPVSSIHPIDQSTASVDTSASHVPVTPETP